MPLDRLGPRTIHGVPAVQLVPMGLYEPPWKYSLKDIGMEVGYHLAYGAGVGAGFAALDPR